MNATYEPLSTPRRNPTERDGVRAAMRDEGRGRLEVSIEERVGEALVEAFLRIYGARFTGR